jgi:hypothetical protein
VPGSHVDTSIAGGRRLVRLSLCAFLLLAGCAASPPAPEPPPVDRTNETAYRLDEVAAKLRQAESIEHDGHRAAAVAVVGTAQRMLPEGHEREHDYLQVIKAGMWAREGDDRDAGKAAELLEEVALTARLRQDWRLLADVELVRVVLALAGQDGSAAAVAGDAALRHLERAGAHRKLVETAGELAFHFLETDGRHAAGFAGRGLDTARRIRDDEAVLRAALVAAHVDLRLDADPEPWLLEAYEAAYRLEDLGWRNVVISRAVNACYLRDDYAGARLWGDRLRSQEMGGDATLPRLEESGLWEADYITMLAQYAFAVHDLSPGNARAREAATLVVEAIEGLPEDERHGWGELAEKLRGGPLQEPAKK